LICPAHDESGQSITRDTVFDVWFRWETGPDRDIPYLEYKHPQAAVVVLRILIRGDELIHVEAIMCLCLERAIAS
jgi:hypothetical protein